MKIKSRSNKPVDPSNFLRALSRKISESRHVPFNFNSQQDAAEVLQFVIDEPKVTSVAASYLISNTIRINISCNQCFCFSAKDEKRDILTIPLSPNINSSLSKFLRPEILESENKWFCPSLNWLTRYQGNFHHRFEFYFSDPAQSIFHFTFKAIKRRAGI